MEAVNLEGIPVHLDLDLSTPTPKWEWDGRPWIAPLLPALGIPLPTPIVEDQSCR